MFDYCWGAQRTLTWSCFRSSSCLCTQKNYCTCRLAYHSRATKRGTVGAVPPSTIYVCKSQLIEHSGVKSCRKWETAVTTLLQESQKSILSTPVAVWAPCHLLNLLLQLPTGSPHGPSAQVRGACSWHQQGGAAAGCGLPMAPCAAAAWHCHQVTLCCCRTLASVGRSTSQCWGSRRGKLPEEGRPPICREWIPLIRGGWLVCCWRTSLTISGADRWAGLSLAAGKQLPACNSKIPSDSRRGPFRCC